MTNRVTGSCARSKESVGTRRSGDSAHSAHGYFCPVGVRLFPLRLGRLECMAAVVCALLLSCARTEPPPSVPAKTATSENGVRFQLAGTRLTVSVPPDAPRTAQSLTRARALDFFCGNRGQIAPFSPVPNSRARFPRGSREVTVALAGADDRFFREAAFCGVEGSRVEAFGYFVPVEEIILGDG